MGVTSEPSATFPVTNKASATRRAPATGLWFARPATDALFSLMARSSVFFLATFFAFASVAVTTVMAQPATEKTDSPNTAQVDRDSIEGWINDLADDDFQTRQHAEQQLLKTGTAALEALESKHDAADNELRLRAARIIGLIVRASLEQSIDDFIAAKISLPGWPTYSATVGMGETARNNFVELYREQHEVLDRLDEPGDGFALLQETLEKSEKANRRPTPATSNLTTCLSIQIIRRLSEVSDPTTLATIRKPLGDYFQRESMRSRGAGQSDAMSALHRAAAVVWLELEDTDSFELSKRLQTALVLNLPEGLKPALRALGQDQPIHSGALRNGLLLVSRYGDKSHVELLMKFLDNNTLLNTARRRAKNGNAANGNLEILVYTTQVGDLALATMINLTEQKYQDYGINLDESPYNDPTLPARLAGFQTDEERNAARKKWSEWHKNAIEKGILN